MGEHHGLQKEARSIFVSREEGSLKGFVVGRGRLERAFINGAEGKYGGGTILGDIP